MPAATQPVDLVFEGGGVKGVGLAGALAELEEQGYAPQNIAGTSAGAITAALLAAGYRGEELREIVMELDFRQFQDKAWEDKSLEEILSAPPSALAGLTEKHDAVLKDALGIKTVRDLGSNKYFAPGRSPGGPGRQGRLTPALPT